MGQKRFERVLKQQQRAVETAESVKRQRGPSIRERVAAYNTELIAAADLSAVRGWSSSDATTSARDEGFSRVHFSNLDVRVDPVAMKEALRRFVTDVAREAGVEDETVGDVNVGTFGPCRPKTRRDRDREHRGFATCAFQSATDAEAVAMMASGRALNVGTDSVVREIRAKVDSNNEYDDEFVKGLRGKVPVVKEVKEEVRKKWNLSELCDSLPMRESCLSTHTRFSDLDGYLRVRFLEYLSTTVPAMPELAGVVLAMEKTSPQYLRVKELLESIEVFKLVVAHLQSAENLRRKVHYDTFFDLACGHGLVGVMLAHAFPGRRVRSFDVARRPAFLAFCHGFANIGHARGSLSPRIEASNVDDCEEKPALPNIDFTHGDIVAAKAFLNDASFVIALHGCNELNKIAVDMARDINALWCVMPCCIKTNIYIPNAIVSKLNDDARYAFMCGAIAAMHDAQLIRSIDVRITNRAIVLCGGITGYVKGCFFMDGSAKILRERAQ
ncbi:hypothetical protein BE221DRAFT_80866 [Ostreococcus tauri]|uniref:Uncharacterized protein n=1 Tax=Ostreococcus tauri TaxID=70448 RepID=A0A1Y5I843_OSTTA|nr:hypothetical protein BE221DRAFT_80866 [Ostreococcus tauri]